MELFIMALIERIKLGSLYEFRQRAGLEPGAIRGALRRLESEGLIARSPGGRRRRRQLTLTPEGARVLDEKWRTALVDHPDAESVLRGAFLAMAMDGPEEVLRYLFGIEMDRTGKAAEKNREADYRRQNLTSPLSQYQWMRSTVEARRQQAEGEAFGMIRQFLEGELTGKPR